MVLSKQLSRVPSAPPRTQTAPITINDRNGSSNVTRLTVTRPAEFQEFLKESINQGIHQRFQEQVRLHGSRVALKTQNRAFTYAETNAFANSLAEEILTVRGKE